MPTRGKNGEQRQPATLCLQSQQWGGLGSASLCPLCVGAWDPGAGFCLWARLPAVALSRRGPQ